MTADVVVNPGLETYDWIGTVDFTGMPATGNPVVIDPFDDAMMGQLITLARSGVESIVAAQNAALGEGAGA